MAVSAPLTTAEELLRMPDDGVRHELIRGESDTFHEVQDKALEWLKAGAIAVLVIDPAKQTATVYRGKGDAHVYGVGEIVDLNDAVPEFSVAVSELFA